MNDISPQQGGLGPRGREILFQPTEDLTSAPAAARDRYIERVEVLDKVGALAMLPDDVHASTEMVAAFYEVDRDAIYQAVKRNRGELDADGYTVLRRAEVTDKLSVTPSDLGMPPTAGSIALFPRRAVLRVGMLLRDSAVARKVRGYLLDTERPRLGDPLDELEAANSRTARAIEIARAERARADGAERERDELAPVAAKFLDAEGDLSVRDAAQALTRAGVRTGERRLFALLDERYGWIKRAVGDGRYRVIQAAIEAGWMSVLPQSHYHPKTGVLVLDPPQPRVTPKGVQRILIDHGAAA